MLQLKVQGGTTKGGKPLCLSCSMATVVRGQNREEVISCSTDRLWRSTQGIVTFPVAECSAYHQVNTPYLHQMKDIAWTIEARRRGPSGFSDPAVEGELEIIVTPPAREHA